LANSVCSDLFRQHTTVALNKAIYCARGLADCAQFGMSQIIIQPKDFIWNNAQNSIINSRFPTMADIT
jgi:hypothetical protein